MVESETTRVTEPRNLWPEMCNNYIPSSIPLVIEEQLTFIEFSNDGFMLLGSNSFNTRYWTGCLHYFSDATTDISTDKCFTGINCEVPITDGKFVGGKDKVIVSEDSGRMSLLSLTEIEGASGNKTTHVVVKVETFDHNSAILSLSVSADNQNIVSGGLDKCIKVWDSDKLETLHTFRPAHAHSVNCVQHSLTDSHVFASCSLDGCILLWDVRLDKPATIVKNGSQEGMTSLSWYPLDSNFLAAGSIFGSIYMYDIRSNDFVTSCTGFNRSLHKLAYSSTGSLGACADSHEVKIFSYENSALKNIYTSNDHDSFVRGLAWHPKETSTLYSCGWDKKVLSHIT